MRRLLALLAFLLPLPALAEAVVDGQRLTTRIVASGLDAPLQLAAPPGDLRLFVVEKTGRIRIIKDGAVLPEPFLDLSGQISTRSEQGLLGLAFSPDFAADQRFFVTYTDPEGTIRIAALTAQGDRADPALMTEVIAVPHPGHANHNGGWLGFGPDGYLYIATGDGGGAGDKAGNAQNPGVLLGKMLRLDVRSLPYTIPPDNPFARGGGLPEIFFTGLRNPWRNSFDGDLIYIADVGQNRYEEINITPLTPGLNFGWNRVEGLACFKAEDCDMSGLTPPALVYDHDQGCSVTGGPVYRGAVMPALQGRYFYADYCTGEVRSFRFKGDRVTDQAVLSGLPEMTGVTSFGVDGAGEIYIVSGSEGTVARLVPAP